MSCDESESSPTVVKGHASLLNEIFGLRASPFVFLVTKGKVLDGGVHLGLIVLFFCPALVFVQNCL